MIFKGANFKAIDIVAHNYLKMVSYNTHVTLTQSELEKNESYTAAILYKVIVIFSSPGFQHVGDPNCLDGTRHTQPFESAQTSTCLSEGVYYVSLGV